MKNSGSAIAPCANDCKPNPINPQPVAACSKSLPRSSSCRFNEETRVKPYYTSSKNKADKLLVPCSTDRHESKKKDDDKKDKTKIRMPQRKGGLQLWQFLYALLEDKNEQHSDLIEWTQNRKDLEFRLNDPEAIALWWGIIKHRANMTYERLSRSLRYYYDRGILKKMGGERYLYRFCIDPEEMYRHIGLSDSRPILKPMPVSVNKWVSNKLLPHQHMEQPYYTDYVPLNIPLHPSQLPPPPPYPGYHFQSAPTSAIPYQSGSSCTLDFYHSEDGGVCSDQNYVPAFSQAHHSEQNYSFNPPPHNTMEGFNLLPPMVSLHESNLPYSGTTLAVGSVNSPIFSYGTSQIQPSQERSLSAMDIPLSDSDSDCSQNRPFSSLSLPTQFHNMNDVIPQLSPTEPPAPGSIYSAQSLQFDCNASPTSTSGGSSELDDIIPLLESMEESNTQQQASNNTSPINNSTTTTSAMYSPSPYSSNDKGTLESYDISTSSISSQNMSFVYSSCITQIPIPTTSTADLHNNSFRSSSWIGEENVW